MLFLCLTDAWVDCRFIFCEKLDAGSNTPKGKLVAGEGIIACPKADANGGLNAAKDTSPSDCY